MASQKSFFIPYEFDPHRRCVVVIKYSDKYISGYRGANDFLVRASNTMDLSSQWIVEFLDKQDVARIANFSDPEWDSETTFIRLKNCKFGKYLRMYDSYPYDSGLVQLKTGFRGTCCPKEEDPVSTDPTCIFEVHRSEYTRVSLEGVATRRFIKVGDNQLWAVERPYKHYDGDPGYDSEPERVPWSTFSFFCSHRPFDESLYPTGVLLHDLDCITKVYGMGRGGQPNNAALSMTEKKKKFRSAPRSCGSQVRGQLIGDLTGKTKAEIKAIEDEEWKKFEEDYKYIEYQVILLPAYKRFYGENEYRDLAELLLYGLFSTILSARSLINHKQLNLDEERRKKLWQRITCLFGNRVLRYYDEICSEVIVLFLKLFYLQTRIKLEDVMDWDLLSRTLREYGVNGITIQFLQRADWAVFCKNMSETQVDVLFEVTQDLLRNYPETSVFRQKMQNKQKERRDICNMNVAAVAFGAVAVIVNIVYLFSEYVECKLLN